jgi:hypothetical protein
MKKISIIALIVAAALLAPSFSHAASVTIEVIDEPTIVLAHKTVSSGDMARVKYMGADIKRWKASFQCPKGISVFLDDQDLCKVTKNFGKSKDHGFVLNLKMVNTTTSSKAVKLNLKTYDLEGKPDTAKATITVRKPQK